jgi:transcriptional regulator with XRE-family HTH domain
VTDDDQPAIPDDTEQRFAANLRLLRERQGISQVKLAQEMAARGWPWRQQTVTRLENGQRMIRFGEATALAEILDTPLERFTRAGPEAAEAERLAAFGARLHHFYETVADTVSRLLDEQRMAEQARATHSQSQMEFVQEAVAVLDAQIEAYEVDKAVSEGTRRFEKLREKHGGEGGAAEPAAPDSGEPTAASGEEGEIVGAPGRADSA